MASLSKDTHGLNAGRIPPSQSGPQRHQESISAAMGCPGAVTLGWLEWSRSTIAAMARVPPPPALSVTHAVHVAGNPGKVRVHPALNTFVTGASSLGARVTLVPSARWPRLERTARFAALHRRSSCPIATAERTTARAAVRMPSIVTAKATDENTNDVAVSSRDALGLQHTRPSVTGLCIAVMV